eukprot:9488684-Pyramimonas_sp.AAC.1
MSVLCTEPRIQRSYRADTFRNRSRIVGRVRLLHPEAGTRSFTRARSTTLCVNRKQCCRGPHQESLRTRLFMGITS